MTGRAAQAVFTSECGKRVRALAASHYEKEKDQGNCREGGSKRSETANPQTAHNVHDRTPQHSDQDSVLVKLHSTKTRGENKKLFRNEALVCVSPRNRIWSSRSYHRTGDESYYG
jgi:hypothetical protein